MRINAAGHALHGELSTSLDGRPLLTGVRATQPDWLQERSETECAYQVQRNGTWFLEACDTSTLATRQLDPKPANTLHARGGVWAAWGPAGIRSNVHPALPLAGLWGVGHDGCFGYCRRQQEGKGLILRAVDGTTHEYAAGTSLLDVHVVSAEVACYTSGYHLHTIGLPEPVTVPEQVFQPRLVDCGGIWWVLYHTQDRLLLQPLYEPVGYVVSNTPNTYTPDAVAIGPRLIRVVWSVTPGEGAAAFRARDIDTSWLRVPLTSPPRPPVVVPPMQKPKVDFVSFGGLIVHGTPWNSVIKDGNNPGVEVDLEINADGGLHVTLINPAGKDRSGLERKVY